VVRSYNFVFGIIFGILALGISSGQMVFAEPDGTIEQVRRGEGDNFDQARTLGLELLEPEPIGVSFFGNGGYSADGLGISSGTLQVEVPADSTIEQSYLYYSQAASQPCGTQWVLQSFNGQQVTLDGISTGTGFGCAYRADVT
jgi:hypothetical protein